MTFISIVLGGVAARLVCVLYFVFARFNICVSRFLMVEDFVLASQLPCRNEEMQEYVTTHLGLHIYTESVTES